eukprot:CAMPEP_0181495328 /NCGR_PEP_ID=MMETSP1110-20121109/52312_1 /TAXON_ID=174948 /ORGANISM="Symbiodinium sp., Strain CCMP421" /LENGTH=116 /DNA_ID=CAMNT_0023622931 /DNA_START=168 /DNA_END=518 /DNA_ORIENTATION=-
MEITSSPVFSTSQTEGETRPEDRRLASRVAMMVTSFATGHRSAAVGKTADAPGKVRSGNFTNHRCPLVEHILDIGFQCPILSTCDLDIERALEKPQVGRVRNLAACVISDDELQEN